MNEQNDQQVGIHPTLCADGKYRWTYVVNLYTNMSIFADLMKVMAACMGLVYLMSMIVLTFNGDMDWEVFCNDTMGFFWVMVGFLFLGFVSYWIWAAISGGRYAALFTMDEEGVMHEQMPKQVKRNMLISEIGLLMGLATDNIALTSNSLLSASVQAWKSDFKDVRKVKVVRRRNLIKVNELLTKNRIYAEPEDLDFVADFICDRCPRV